MVVEALNFGLRDRVPVILQSEAAECGLACLAMVANYYKYSCDLASLRRKFAVSIKGLTFADLVEMSSKLMLHARPVQLDLAGLKKLQLPAVLHWQFKHFVVLTQVRKNYVVIHDPSRGKRKIFLDELSKSFTGAALELTPASDFQIKDDRKNVSFKQLLGPMPGLKSTVAEILALAIALEFFAILSPLFLQFIIDNAVVSQDIELVKALGFGFLLLSLFKIAIDCARGWLLLYLGTHVNLQLMANLMRHLVRLPMDFFEKRHVGDVVSRFESLNVIQRTLTTSFIAALIDGLLASVTLAVMFTYNTKLTIIVLLAICLYLILRVSMYQISQDVNEEHIVKAARQSSHFLETVRGIQCVKLFNRAESRQATWHNLMIGSFNANIKSQVLGILYSAFKGGVFSVENIAVISLGGLLVIDGSLSAGMLIAFLSYKLQFVDRANGLIDKYLEFRMLSLHRNRVADIALTEPEAVSDTFSVAALEKTAPATIEVKDLSFRYSDNEPFILKDVNLSIRSGESVAIVGPSGCGKTTLLKLILGLLQPTSGEILIDGVSLSQLGLAAYREQIGAVMQDDQLFAGSITDNICFFDEQTDLTRVKICAARAAIHEDISAMPMQYATLVGDMGSALSGGQRQRLFLARALYKEPTILFLDEATSHLDIELEKRVSFAISQIPMTRVLIAHRPETIASANRVVRLTNGTAQILPGNTECNAKVSQP